MNIHNAGKFGVGLLGYAVLDCQHTVVLIAEDKGKECLQNFMQRLAQTGTEEILPTSTCETVVAEQGEARFQHDSSKGGI